VSDPRVRALGRSTRANGEGRSRPSRLHRHIGARTAGSKERRPLNVGHRRNVVHHQQFAYISRGEKRNDETARWSPHAGGGGGLRKALWAAWHARSATDASKAMGSGCGKNQISSSVCDGVNGFVRSSWCTCAFV
jgi:hypothetical protein